MAWMPGARCERLDTLGDATQGRAHEQGNISVATQDEFVAPPIAPARPAHTRAPLVTRPNKKYHEKKK